jgi:integrase
MARARFQEGRLGVEGKGSRAHYFVRFRVYLADGKAIQKKVTIGLVSKLSKREATKQKAAIVAKETSQLPEVLAGQRGEMSFESFYQDRFLPLKANWSKAHHKNFIWQMDNYVLPKFGKLAVADVDKVMVQSHLNSLCPKYSKSSIRHVREKLVTVFEEAVEQEFIGRNPAKKTVIPTTARDPKTPVMTLEQLIQLIDSINNVRDKAIFLVGTFCAPRTSEVFGLSWRQFHQSAEGELDENYFLIDQIGYDGEILHTTKTKASKAKVHIGPMTLAAILKLRSEAKDTSPDALLFGSTNKNGRSKKGAPMSAGAWLTKRIQPIADALGIPFKVNFRATRRTASTLVQEHGHSLGSAQGFLRHASPNTTAGHYTISIPENVKLAVNDYEERVFAARKTPKLVRVK